MITIERLVDLVKRAVPEVALWPEQTCNADTWIKPLE